MMCKDIYIYVLCNVIHKKKNNQLHVITNQSERKQAHVNEL